MWEPVLAVAVFLGFIAGVTLGIPIVIRRWGRSCDKCVHRMWVYQNESAGLITPSSPRGVAAHTGN